jgi:hypothetical protein
MYYNSASAEFLAAKHLQGALKENGWHKEGGHLMQQALEEAHHQSASVKEVT